uniref:Reverse transcriptase domain-containing protein n=1 Tax=Photinus pyralis TaxID=7054 RepID=A0A1Y1M3X1_PHOPY
MINSIHFEKFSEFCGLEGKLSCLVFINDIGANIISNVLLYADDMKVFRTINNINDCKCLQEDLKNIEVWCELNRLSLNINKCCVVSYGRKENLITFSYSLCDTGLRREDEVSDLGVLFDSKLNFNSHICQLTNSCSRTLGFVIRNCKLFTNRQTFFTLYRCYVLSKINYCSVIWNSMYEKYLKMLESVQKRFLKYVYYRKNGYYPDHADYELLLSNTELLLLKQYCQLNSMLYLYKITHHLIDDTQTLHQLKLVVPRKNIRQQRTFEIGIPRTSHYQNSPLYRMCNYYNNLNIDIFCNNLAQIRKNILSLL